MRKLGIIKKGVPVIVAPQKVEAFQVIERIAKQQSAPMVVVGKDFQYRLNSSSLDGQDMSIWNSSWEKAEQVDLESIDLHIPLLGRHQIENAATAYRSAPNPQ